MAQSHSLYDVLNVGCSASVPEIKKEYRKLAKEFHPDKNPLTGDKFKEISFAHEVLTDPHKRAVYDQYGINGLKDIQTRAEHTHCHDNIFSHIFGNSFFGMDGRKFQSRRLEDSIYPLKVTLEDLYNGKTFKCRFTKNVVCVSCKGIGTKSGVSHVCHICQGTGVRMHYRQVILLMQQQIQTPCFHCVGQGTIIPDTDRCDRCIGKKTCVETKNMDVFVEKGMEDTSKIILRGEGNQVPGMESGDVLVILQEQPHEVFRRINSDLYIKKDVSLTEALCGVSFGLKHLDGRMLRVVQTPGSCITNGQIKGIQNEGMPFRRNSTIKGNLYIKFNIVFPQNYFADETQLKLIETVLGPRPEFKMPTGEDMEEVDLHDYTPSQTSSSSRYNGEAYSEEDHDHSYYGSSFGDRGRVQCAHQ